MTVPPLLVVCTGNICRSPLAAELVRRATPAAVESYGTAALEGHAPPRATLDAARRLGLDLAAHRARQLTVDAVGHAPLVLALAREHRRAVVSLVPRANRSTFTLREFARLTRLVDPDDTDRAMASAPDAAVRLQRAVALAAARRGSGRLAAADEDDVVDPFGCGPEVYARSTAQIVTATNDVAAYLGRALGA
ncbi:low molecular weight phosphatase family protein [Frigoribacterium sp. PhB24]|uniref:arsenate reductase/protein-tyrosine-phosphatase family protein n=1 Tax=Frigoribacterium sp. PhB24 TaxID=2485204 RepID=UPI000F9F861E|nr:low molecular weight phosphatase family protein [Frigoribacterium sp. PhB24]ROS47971.1 protein-tyrosine phosphatase [Frigoribacterium sp. PhB24]